MTEVRDQKSEVRDQRSESRTDSTMTRKIILLALCSLLLAPCSAAESQQPAKIPRIGCLYASSLSSARIEAFRQGLRELGYVEGENIVIEWRSAEGKYDRLPALAAELVLK